MSSATIYLSSYDYVSSYYCICVSGVGGFSRRALAWTVSATIYVSSYYYICVLILLYMCAHTTVCASVGKAAFAGARRRGQYLLLSPVLQSGLLRFSGTRTYI